MALQPGVILNGRYRIVELLGQGGFGAVYRAWDLQMEGACAVKENLELSPAAQQQFEREAKLLYKLRHPSLPRVFDHFLAPGQGQYLVMDYIEGEDLQDALERRSGPLPVLDVLKWIEQVCDALAYLHSQTPPIIHRDIKPANIRITPLGQAMLVDFGIAKIYDAARKTTVGARAITQGYSPPEQYGMGATDARSDIYALGASAYHMLTGELPPASIDLMTRTEHLRSVYALNPAVPMQVSNAIAQAMSLERERRPGNALEFKEALLSNRSIYPDQAVQPVPPTQVVRNVLSHSERDAATFRDLPPDSDPISGDAGHAAPSPHPHSTQPPAFTPVGSKYPLWLIAAGAGLVVLCGVVGLLGLVFGLGPFLAEATNTPRSIALETTETEAESRTHTPRPTQTNTPHPTQTNTPAPTWTSVSSNPELEPAKILTYCDMFDDSPVTVKRNQPVIFFWGWSATSMDLLQDHISAVIYTNTLDGVRLGQGVLQEIYQKDDGWYVARWELNYGVLSPGKHRTEYNVTWRVKIFDGEDYYGPGTNFETGEGFCDIIVE
jgi:serine/threonine-protein kinase